MLRVLAVPSDAVSVVGLSGVCLVSVWCRDLVVKKYCI
jgi:hypothetical protein